MFFRFAFLSLHFSSHFLENYFEDKLPKGHFMSKQFNFDFCFKISIFSEGWLIIWLFFHQKLKFNLPKTSWYAFLQCWFYTYLVQLTDISRGWLCDKRMSSKYWAKVISVMQGSSTQILLSLVLDKLCFLAADVHLYNVLDHSCAPIVKPKLAKGALQFFGKIYL